MPKTIESQIYEHLAPIQPADCKAVNTQRLVAAIRATGPVVHRGQLVSVEGDQVKFEDRPRERIPATRETDTDGVVTETPERDPTDKELSEQWKVPLAKDVPLGESTTS